MDDEAAIKRYREKKAQQEAQSLGQRTSDTDEAALSEFRKKRETSTPTGRQAIPVGRKLLEASTKTFGGLAGAAGKVLLASQQATTGLIEGSLEKGGVLEDRGTTPVSAVKAERSNIDVLRRLGVETPLGQSSVGGAILGNYNPTESVFGNFVHELPVTAIGTVADIFLDPLNFAWKPVSAGIKGLAEAGGVAAKSLAQEIPAVQKIYDMLGKAFVTRYGQREAFVTLDKSRKVAEGMIGENVNKIVSPVIEQPQHIQKRVAQIIKGGLTDKKDLQILSEPIRTELDRVGESISKLNPKLLSEETFAANKGTYFPRLYTDYEFPIEDAIGGFGKRAISIPGDAFKPRLADEEFAMNYLRRLGTEEAKRQFPEAVLTRTDAQLEALQSKYPDIEREYITTKNLGLNTVKRIAEMARKELGEIEEAGYPALKRLLELNVVESRQKFFSEVAQLASDVAKPGWIQMADSKDLGELAGKFLPAAEYKAIADIRSIPTATEEMYKRAISLWKTFKTAYNPATIARNDITNFLVLNPLGGVGPHRLDVYARTFNELTSKGPLYQLARQNGLEISTEQAAELTTKASRFYNENKGLVGQFFNKVSDFHQAVKNFYGSQDKFFKLANFIKGITEDSLTPAQAMKRAQLYLVDYSEMPELVNWLRNSVIGIPFISFTYGVSKPLAKTLIENPARLGAYYKILSGIQQMNPERESQADRERELDTLPEWIIEGSYLRLPVKDKYNRSQYVDLQYILPFNIIEQDNLRPGNPIWNLGAALFLNKDPFTEKEITKTTDTKAEKLQKMSTYILSTLTPSLTPAIGTSYNKIENALRKRPDRNGFIKSRLEAFVDVLGGIKITPIDPTIEAQKRANERQRELLELRGQLKSILLDNSLFPDEKEERIQEAQQKINRVLSPDSDVESYLDSLNQ